MNLLIIGATASALLLTSGVVAKDRYGHRSGYIRIEVAVVEYNECVRKHMRVHTGRPLWARDFSIPVWKRCVEKPQTRTRLAPCSYVRIRVSDASYSYPRLPTHGPFRVVDPVLNVRGSASFRMVRRRGVNDTGRNDLYPEMKLPLYGGAVGVEIPTTFFRAIANPIIEVAVFGHSGKRVRILWKPRGMAGDRKQVKSVPDYRRGAKVVRLNRFKHQLHRGAGLTVIPVRPGDCRR